MMLNLENKHHQKSQHQKHGLAYISPANYVELLNKYYTFPKLLITAERKSAHLMSYILYRQAQQLQHRL